MTKKWGRNLIVPLMLTLAVLSNPLIVCAEQNVQNPPAEQTAEQAEAAPAEGANEAAAAPAEAAATEGEQAEGAPAEEAPSQEAPATQPTTRRRTASGSNSASTQSSSENTEETKENEGEQGDSYTKGQYKLTFTANSNLRSDPDTSSVSKLVIPFGMTIVSDSKVTNSQGEVWYSATYGNSAGYVREDMVTVEEIQETTPQESAEETQEPSEETQESAEEMQEPSEEATHDPETEETNSSISQNSSKVDGSSVEEYSPQDYAHVYETGINKKIGARIDIFSILFTTGCIIAVALLFVFSSRLLLDYKTLKKKYIRFLHMKNEDD